MTRFVARTERGPVAVVDGSMHAIPGLEWDDLLRRDDLASELAALLGPCLASGVEPGTIPGLLPPVGSQEVWASGVTYERSRAARMEESGGADVYARVYEADRPELFVKAMPHRVAGHGQPVRIRRDARWSVPEPELAVVVSASGRIAGYTIGNDMSSRDIEGENPLYLPQAKIWDGSCALGPAVLVTGAPLPPDTEIRLEIRREGRLVQEGATWLARMRRTPEELVAWLYRECTFPAGCVLLTGTGVVPEPGFTLASGDEIAIAIGPLGVLVNRVA